MFEKPMPRSAGSDAPGILHLVIIRGIKRQGIFRNKADREDFVDPLSKLVPENPEKLLCVGFDGQSRTIQLKKTIFNDRPELSPLVKPYQLSVIKIDLRVIGLARVDIVDYDTQLARCRGERKQYPVFFG